MDLSCLAISLDLGRLVPAGKGPESGQLRMVSASDFPFPFLQSGIAVASHIPLPAKGQFVTIDHRSPNLLVAGLHQILGTVLRAGKTNTYI